MEQKYIVVMNNINGSVTKTKITINDFKANYETTTTALPNTTIVTPIATEGTKIAKINGTSIYASNDYVISKEK